MKGYINATEIAKSYGKLVKNIEKAQWFMAIAQNLSVKLGLPIERPTNHYDIMQPMEEPLIERSRGNGGVYWHPLLAEEVQRAMRYKAIVKPSREEAEVVARYSGRTEVVTPVGRIDIGHNILCPYHQR